MVLLCEQNDLITGKRSTTAEVLRQRMAVREAIARGEMAVAEGRVVPHAEAKTHMARWLK
jgi:predicted transcriptional regulator